MATIGHKQSFERIRRTGEQPVTTSGNATMVNPVSKMNAW